MYISCGDERKNLTADGINPVKIGGRQPADTGAAIQYFETHRMLLSTLAQPLFSVGPPPVII